MSELISAVRNLQNARSTKAQEQQIMQFGPEAVDSSHQNKQRRAKGKRSNPAFEQVTAYIQKETYLSTKMALLQEGGLRDFSELIEDLLSGYLRTQKSRSSGTQPDADR